MTPAAFASATPTDIDRIVVIGGSRHTLDLLRLATVRSDEIVLIAEAIDDATRRFVDHFAVEYRPRQETDADLVGATAVLVSLGDVERENLVVRNARRRRIPIHVDNRAFVSDFTMLDLVERRPATFAR